MELDAIQEYRKRLKRRSQKKSEIKCYGYEKIGHIKQNCR